ncbi:hypothetical protein HPB51_017288 [Rhipicephalus microplus]|uniref:Uncharacterized protein n=1 Tax=Rhipicephalus microplus TaxID=6941 RepID=A0A9J6EU97_RHIMP|nr:hypothetical protein HPB51_017288 [Rhipicephalus microplus]
MRVTSLPQGWHPMNGPVQNDLPKQPVAAPRTPKSPAARTTNSSTAKSPVLNGNQAPKEPRSSAELVKLREQMDRISQENRRLTFQLKEKEQEIRRLKSQLQPAAPAKTPVKTPTRTPTKTPPKTPPVPSRGSGQKPASSKRAGSAATEPRKNVATAKRSNTFSVTRGPPQPDDKTETSEITVESRSTPANYKLQQSSASSNSKETSAPAAAVGSSKPTATVKPAGSNPLPDAKAEAIRRQHAARKIQRVWRQHRRRASAASLTASKSSKLSENSNLSQDSQMSSKAKPMEHN